MDHNLEEMLDDAEAEVLRDLAASGYRLSDPRLARAVLDIKNELRRRFEPRFQAWHSVPYSEVLDSFRVEMVAAGFKIHSSRLRNTLHVRGHVNANEAIALWLGLDVQPYDARRGLWGAYAELGKVAPRRLGVRGPDEIGPPDVSPFIQRTFDHPKGSRDEILRFVEDHWKLARSQVEADLRAARAELATVPTPSPSAIRQLRARQAVLEAWELELAGVPDARRLAAWMIATGQGRRARLSGKIRPNAVAESVANGVRRGHNTLRVNLLRRVLATIGGSSGYPPAAQGPDPGGLDQQ